MPDGGMYSRARRHSQLRSSIGKKKLGDKPEEAEVREGRPVSGVGEKFVDKFKSIRDAVLSPEEQEPSDTGFEQKGPDVVDAPYQPAPEVDTVTRVSVAWNVRKFGKQVERERKAEAELGDEGEPDVSVSQEDGQEPRQECEETQQEPEESRQEPEETQQESQRAQGPGTEKTRSRRVSRSAQRAYNRNMGDWHQRYDESGTIDHERYLDELCYHILDEQQSFVNYTTDMKLWMKEAEASAEMDKRSDEYCRNMLDYCISPLQHGISAESIVDTVGIYVGMSLMSKDFRDKVGSELARLSIPIRDKLGQRSAMKKDERVARNLERAMAIERKMGHSCSALDECDPPAVPENHKVKWAREYIRDHYEGENMVAHKEKMAAMAERIAMTKNRGRIPLTPETAALQKLNFLHNYYVQRRNPNVDRDVLEKQFNAANETLLSLMKKDGVEKADMQRSYRTIVGQLTAVHPEFEKEFGGLAFDEMVRSQGSVEKKPSLEGDGCVEVPTWRGEYVKRSDGTPFVEEFAPRRVQDVDEYQVAMSEYFKGIFDKLNTADKVVAALDSPWMEKVSHRFMDMMKDDFTYLDAVDKLDKPRDPDRIFNAVVKSATDEWKEKHPAAVEDYLKRLDEAEKARMDRKLDFGASDVKDIYEEEDQYGD